MKLFDDGIRTRTGPALNSEPAFTFLNQTARVEFGQVRDMLELWFEHYPDSAKDELQKAFVSSVNTQHRGAFFELVLHELLIKLGYKVTVHPPIPGLITTPDFLAEASPSDRFYLEATLATGESRAETAAQARINTVYDVLNRTISSPNFFLWLEIDGVPATPPPARKLATFIEAELANLDPDEIHRLYEIGGPDALPTWYFEHDGWSVEIQPIPKKPEARGKPNVRPVGGQSQGFHFVDDRTPIRNAILDKAGHYGKLELPYIVAVNALELVDETDVTEALLGQEKFILLLSEGPRPEVIATEPGRELDGVWTSPTGPRNTRVSGVLFASRLMPWSIPSAVTHLYHNPWAARPLPAPSALTRIPYSRSIEKKLKPFPGESLSALLGLDKNWPGQNA